MDFSILANTAQSAVGAAYSTVQPTFQLAVRDGVSSAVNTAQQQQINQTVPIVLAGAALLISVLAVGLYVMRPR